MLLNSKYGIDDAVVETARDAENAVLIKRERILMETIVGKRFAKALQSCQYSDSLEELEGHLYIFTKQNVSNEGRFASAANDISLYMATRGVPGLNCTQKRRSDRLPLRRTIA